jgi:hypothetical protein
VKNLDHESGVNPVRSPDDEPYKPNKYTRYISLDDWRKIIRGEPTGAMTLIDPGYVNEPHEEPRKA